MKWPLAVSGQSFVAGMALYALAATNAWYFAIRRDLRRAALFLWMTPLSATRSSTLTACSVAASAALESPEAMASSAFLTNVRASERNGLFRSRRRSATRIRFFADFELAKVECPPQCHNTIHPEPSRRAPYPTKSRRFPQDAYVRIAAS